MIPKDLKNTPAIDDKIVDCLRDPGRFSFCFVLPKGRCLLRDVQHARASIDVTLATMERWKNRSSNEAMIKRMRAVRQQANAKGFNIRLFSDVILVSTLVVMISYYITKYSNPRIIGWFSDRDAITSAFGKIANDLFAINHAAICQERGLPFAHIQIGLGDPRIDPNAPKRSWYDAIVRIPDFVAGTLAAFDFNERRVTAATAKGVQKIIDIIDRVISQSDNISIMILEIRPDYFGSSTMRLKPPPPE